MVQCNSPLSLNRLVLNTQGWLKVAQSIEKPFGEDDSDFEMKSLVRRHIRVSASVTSVRIPKKEIRKIKNLTMFVLSRKEHCIV